MGKELEIKYCVENERLLDEIAADEQITRVCDMEIVPMQTTYYDTADRQLSRQKQMLRGRLEAGRAVLTFKTPPDASGARGEWNLDADGLWVDGRILPQALTALTAQGAPQELERLSGLVPVCGVRFTRRRCVLELPGQTRAELALDAGVFHNGDRQQSFTELELELLHGEFDAVRRFAEQLALRYGLTPQPLSKFQRAREL